MKWDVKEYKGKGIPVLDESPHCEERCRSGGITPSIPNLTTR
jgi:hypothetical protein